MGKPTLELNKLPEWATKNSGYGYGYGYGSGYGYGDGYGSGDGYGYGDGSTEMRKIYFDALLQPYQRGDDRKVMFWRCNPDGSPANGGSGTKARVGLTEEIAGPLEICTRRALHGTRDPLQWRGEHWWVVALHAPFVSEGDKAGSLKRTFLADLGKCPFQIR